MQDTVRVAEFAGRIAEGMDVCDVAGEKIGKVARLHRRTGAAGEDSVVEVKTGFLGLGSHLYVPIGEVQDMTSECVFLRVAKEVAEGWREPPAGLEAAR
ncbi:MAG TPA: hypothetical protein VFC93_13380 [Chloroflexota bacterium]|jgi:hypothetical protein|nr:hypothetical protein [Chloroflexota bacterium]